ncbi:MAG TPA: hypothetical protein VFU99_09270 [Gaiellaceae bacterium]|nr:hypothetical protein [Gaiellaceae bacterium]
MRKLTTAVAIVVASVTVAAAASAGGEAAKQRVAIQGQGSVFTLQPLGDGGLQSDRGSSSFCCWTTRSVVRDGQAVDITTGPQMTLVGRHGTLVARNRMEWLAVSGGYSLFTGTWEVVRGTGDYAGVTGGGRVAGVELPNGVVKWRREGLLAPR